MVERAPAQGIALPAPLDGFVLRESVAYPNGGRSLFYVCDGDALILGDGICQVTDDRMLFDYSLITSMQNAYAARYRRVFRFLREDVGQAERFLRYDIEYGEAIPKRMPADQANIAEATPLERAFEEHFANVYGANSTQCLWREYGITDAEGHTRYIDYVVRTRNGLLGVEENGVSYHHPQIIGRHRYREQLLKQNSCQQLGIKPFRFSTEDCRFAERFEDDIRSYFGNDRKSFLDPGLVLDRPFELYEHQEGALDEIDRRRAEGTKSFLAVLPTASGKSRIVEEDLARFAYAHPDCRALILAPSTAIVDDWKHRIRSSFPALANRTLVCTYGFMTRRYTQYAPDDFDYIVVDEAHHAVAPALKRTIQYFDPAFLIGLTATDQRPDKKSLSAVFGSYRAGLSLTDAMEKGIVATARAFRIETNVDLSNVRINGRDYVNADLEKTVRVTSRNDLIVDVLREYFCEGDAGRCQGVAFCANVRHAKEMKRLLCAACKRARAIYGQSKGRTAQAMRDFRDGKIRFLCSCQMISQGWDYPELGILVMTRPTLLRVLYLQQLGRGLRRTPSKRDVFVIDVVDEYGSMAAPCSLHSIFQNPYYVPFGSILRRDYEPGEWVEVDGVRERIERIVEVDVASFAERYEGYLSVEQVAREFFVSTGTFGGWVRRGRLAPTVTFEFGSRRIHMFSPEDVEAARVRLGIPVHDDTTIRDDFLAFLEARDYSLSYKMPFMLSFLDHMDSATGAAQIDDVLDDYIAFYADRLRRGLRVDRATCPYDEARLANRKFVRSSMLTNPFEKFERKRFMYYSRDLGQISLNHALLASLSAGHLDTIRAQMHADLDDYYVRL